MRSFMKASLGAAAFAAAFISSASPTQAHLDFAMFDTGTVIVVTGTVTRFDFGNPHSWLFIEAPEDAERGGAWLFEMEGAPVLARQGVRRGFMEPGEVVTVRGNPVRDGRQAGYVLGLVKADGVTFGEIEGLEPPEPDDL